MKVSGIEIVPTMVEGGLRIRDVDLGERLGFDRSRDVRKIIERHIENLNKINQLATVARWVDRPQGGRVEVKEYWLDRKQAIFITAKSETAEATDITIEIIEKFDAYEKGMRPTAPSADAMALLNDTATLHKLLLSKVEEVMELESKVTTLAEEVSTMTPKAQSFDRMTASKGSLMRDPAAKASKVTRKYYTELLIEKDIAYRGSDGRIHAKRWAEQAGLVEEVSGYRKDKDGNPILITVLYITPKGFAYMLKEIEERNDPSPKANSTPAARKRHQEKLQLPIAKKLSDNRKDLN